MRAHWKKKTVVLALGLTLVVGGGGAAFAYWTTTGSGSGSATTGTTTKDIAVGQTSSVVGLYPGGTAALAGTLTNSSAGKVYVHSIDATITAVSSNGKTPACAITDYNLTGFPVTVDTEIDPTTPTNWAGASIQMLDTAANQDDCKDATVTIAYTSN